MRKNWQKGAISAAVASLFFAKNFKKSAQPLLVFSLQKFLKVRKNWQKGAISAAVASPFLQKFFFKVSKKSRKKGAILAAVSSPFFANIPAKEFLLFKGKGRVAHCNKPAKALIRHTTISIT